MDQQKARQLAQQCIDQLHQVEDGNQESIDTLGGIFSDNAGKCKRFTACFDPRQTQRGAKAR